MTLEKLVDPDIEYYIKFSTRERGRERDYIHKLKKNLHTCDKMIAQKTL